MLIPFIFGIFFFSFHSLQRTAHIAPYKEGNFLQVSLGLQTNLCACFK